MKKMITALMVMLATVAAGAADGCTATGCVSTIKTLYTNTNGIVYIGTPHDENVADCSPASGVYFTLDTGSGTVKNADEMYASMLAAFISGTKIQLRIKPGSSVCALAYVRLDTGF